MRKLRRKSLDLNSIFLGSRELGRKKFYRIDPWKLTMLGLGIGLIYANVFTTTFYNGLSDF